MKKLLNRIRPTSQKGQSLVEMAIITPILIFMLLGVFEVGWALRGYLVLTNVNREITRFAIRPGYLDYSIKNPTITAATTVGYDKVLSYTYTTLSDQLPLDFSTGQTSTLIISHLVVDTGLPCPLDDNGQLTSPCNCNQFVNPPNSNFYLNGTNVLTYDDLILHPKTPSYEYYYVYTFPLTSPYRTQLNYPEMAAQLARENNKFNCELIKKSTGTIPSANNVIVTELYYNQPQLFGFPIIANPYTNPVPMYTHTTMRMIVASRSGANVDTVGPTCDAYPFIFRRSVLPAEGGTVDIFGGPGGSDFGWLGWNGIPTTDLDEGYLENELRYPRMALNDFYDVRDTSDRALNVGDYVASLEGINAAVEASEELVSALLGKTIRVPVYGPGPLCGGTGFCTGSPNYYHISGFVWVRINSITDINLPGQTVNATYIGDASQGCQ